MTHDITQQSIAIKHINKLVKLTFEKNSDLQQQQVLVNLH